MGVFLCTFSELQWVKNNSEVTYGDYNNWHSAYGTQKYGGCKHGRRN